MHYAPSKKLPDSKRYNYSSYHFLFAIVAFNFGHMLLCRVDVFQVQSENRAFHLSHMDFF
jgi:hypothetical protein